MLNSTILSAGKMCEVSFLTEQGLWEVLMLLRKRCEELLATLKQLVGKLRVLSMGSGVLPMTKKSRFIPTLTILTVGMREVSGLQLPSEQKFEVSATFRSWERQSRDLLLLCGFYVA